MKDVSAKALRRLELRAAGLTVTEIARLEGVTLEPVATSIRLAAYRAGDGLARETPLPPGARWWERTPNDVVRKPFVRWFVHFDAITPEVADWALGIHQPLAPDRHLNRLQRQTHEFMGQYSVAGA
jgi:hypothetical protein